MNDTKFELNAPAREGLPDRVVRVLEQFLGDAFAALGDRLESVVLFGSAAEGRLRAASDVNLILVLREFPLERAAALEPALSFAGAAIGLRAMFLLASEIDAAHAAFAQKFADIARRRRVLFGPDPFAGKAVPHEALRSRTRQVLLNLLLRMREQWIAAGTREDRLLRLLREAVGPLRSCAAALLELEGARTASPKEALAAIAERAGGELAHLPAFYSALREGAAPEPGAAVRALAETMSLIEWMQRRIA